MKTVQNIRIKILAAIAITLVIWAGIDVYGPRRSDLKEFSPDNSAILETSSWKAYYDKKPTQLFLYMTRILQTQQGMPPIRALFSAYWTAKAAFLFKEGHKRAEYARALPYLEEYYGALCRTGGLERNTRELAIRELDWWIIHRERGRHGETALVRAIADVTSELYGVTWDKMIPYARLRAEAMLERSERDQAHGLTDADWAEVEGILKASYHALFRALHNGKDITG